MRLPEAWAGEEPVGTFAGGWLQRCAWSFSVFSGQQWIRETGAELIRRETGCFLEWGNHDIPDGDGEREIYGIRFVPETLEVQFYRRIQENAAPME